MPFKDNVRFATAAQATIFRNELQGQLSDGYWENESTDHRLWSCDVRCEPRNVGISFHPKHKVDFSDLWNEAVDDRMIALARQFDKEYDSQKLLADLEEITRVVFGGK